MAQEHKGRAQSFLLPGQKVGRGFFFKLRAFRELHDSSGQGHFHSSGSGVQGGSVSASHTTWIASFIFFKACF